MRTLVLVAILAVVAFADFYGANDDVVNLTPENFQEEVLSSKQIVIVEFYAPWCGHCKALTPEWKKAGTALKGIAKVAAADADKHRELGSKYGVQGFPTIKVFGLNKKASPTDYEGGRKAGDIVKSVINEFEKSATERLTGKKAGSGNDVITLTNANFETEVLKSTDAWLVEFFAPWCGHCKSLEPEWKKAATALKGKVKVGAVDATKNDKYNGQYGIQGFPTIKFFGKGEKSGNPEDYNGGRTAADIQKFALGKI